MAAPRRRDDSFIPAPGTLWGEVMERRTLPEKLIAADELLWMPEPEFWRTELVQGRIIREPPAYYDHGNIVTRIVIRSGSYVEAHRL